MTLVHLLVPDGWLDPSRPSGGNTYDRRIRDGLRAGGWVVQVHEVARTRGAPDRTEVRAIEPVLGSLDDEALVILDGLLVGALPPAIEPLLARLRVVVLVHLPLGCAPGAAAAVADLRDRERRALPAASAVVTTSAWTRDWLVTAYRIDPRLVRVVTPGADPAPIAPGSRGGRRLLCVGAVTATKGQDVLVAALGRLVDLDWTCRIVGALTIEPEFARAVAASTRELRERVRLVGPCSGPELAARYAGCDLLVVPSRMETYGMVATEALARGVPVIGSDVGGLPEAIGRTASGEAPGVLVPASDPESLALALRRWLTHSGLRDDLRRRALERRAELRDWGGSSAELSHVLSEVAA